MIQLISLSNMSLSQQDQDQHGTLWDSRMEQLSWTHYTQDLWAHNWNLEKIIFALMFILMIKSGHNFAHTMTA